MTSLLGLSPEIIGEIATYAGPIGISHLWCATPLLWNALSAPYGISSYDANITSENSNWKMPLLLSRLQGLKRLKISAISETRHLASVSIHNLLSLPPSIQHIEFSFYEATSCWTDWSIGPESAFAEKDGFFPFNQIFPCLQTLKLYPATKDERSKGGGLFQPSIRPSRLPASLTELAVPMAYLDPKDELSLLPKSLKKVSFGEETLWTNSNFKSTERFSLSTLSICTSESAETYALLPKSLVELSVYERRTPPGDWFHLLPPLQILYLPNAFNLDPLRLLALPETLTSLKVENIAWKQPEDVILLPRALTAFSLSHAHNFPNGALKHLPPNLLHLELNRLLHPLSETMAKQLPSKLRLLQVPRCAFNVFYALPPQLETFRLADASTYNVESLHLPKQLKELDLSISVAKQFCYRRLPPWLPAEQYQDPKIPGWTGILWAAKQGHIDVLQFFIGSSVIPARLLGAIIVEAIPHGHLAVLEWLEIHHHVNWPQLTHAAGNWIAGLAAEHGHKHILLYLKKRKQSFLDAPNRLTLAHKAASGGSIAILEWLDQEGVDFKLRTIFGETPVHKAALRGHLNVLEWLEAKGMDVVDRDAKDYEGNIALSPLALAAEIRSYPCMEWLISRGASLSTLLPGDTTIAHRAVWSGHLDLLQWLFQHHPYTKDDASELLQVSIARGHGEISTWLRTTISKFTRSNAQ